MYLKNKNKLINNMIFFFAGFLLISCEVNNKIEKITPDIITEKTANDADDPAIWINKNDPSKSIVFGTDKASEGAVYAFNLEGKIIKEKSIFNIARPNNVDISYDFVLSDSTKTDIIVFTEREKEQIRLFSVPDMKPLDNGGFKVFEDEKEQSLRLPMGIALYKSSISNKTYAIVGRKSGPKQKYLYQYELISDSTTVKAKLVRKFGDFSGKKEIEAIAVDAELGYVYYSDEQHCIRKYYADPEKGDKEISCFGGDYFKEDIEGIAIARTQGYQGFIIVSDQQRGTFNVFDRNTNDFIKAVNLSTLETDGCEVTTVSLGSKYPNGLFVAMNDESNFFFYDLSRLSLSNVE